MLAIDVVNFSLQPLQGQQFRFGKAVSSERCENTGAVAQFARESNYLMISLGFTDFQMLIRIVKIDFSARSQITNEIYVYMYTCISSRTNKT